MLGDKGYDAKANRQAARRRGICPAIPYRENAAAKPKFFPKILYKGRARIEQAVGKLKRFKRIALRCEKTAQNFAAFVALVCAFTLRHIQFARSHLRHNLASRLFKIGALVRVSVRRIKIAIASGCPFQNEFTPSPICATPRRDDDPEPGYATYPRCARRPMLPVMTRSGCEFADQPSLQCTTCAGASDQRPV